MNSSAQQRAQSALASQEVSAPGTPAPESADPDGRSVARQKKKASLLSFWHAITGKTPPIKSPAAPGTSSQPLPVDRSGRPLISHGSGGDDDDSAVLSRSPPAAPRASSVRWQSDSLSTTDAVGTASTTAPPPLRPAVTYSLLDFSITDNPGMHSQYERDVDEALEEHPDDILFYGLENEAEAEQDSIGEDSLYDPHSVTVTFSTLGLLTSSSAGSTSSNGAWGGGGNSGSGGNGSASKVEYSVASETGGRAQQRARGQTDGGGPQESPRVHSEYRPHTPRKGASSARSKESPNAGTSGDGPSGVAAAKSLILHWTKKPPSPSRPNYMEAETAASLARRESRLRGRSPAKGTFSSASSTTSSRTSRSKSQGSLHKTVALSSYATVRGSRTQSIAPAEVPSFARPTSAATLRSRGTDRRPSGNTTSLMSAFSPLPRATSTSSLRPSGGGSYSNSSGDGGDDLSRRHRRSLSHGLGLERDPLSYMDQDDVALLLDIERIIQFQDARIARFEATTGGGSSGDAAAGSEDEDDKIHKAEKIRQHQLAERLGTIAEHNFVRDQRSEEIRSKLDEESEALRRMMEEVLTAKQWRANVRKEQRYREKLEIIAERQRERERAIKIANIKKNWYEHLSAKEKAELVSSSEQEIESRRERIRRAKAKLFDRKRRARSARARLAVERRASLERHRVEQLARRIDSDTFAPPPPPPDRFAGGYAAVTSSYSGGSVGADGKWRP